MVSAFSVGRAGRTGDERRTSRALVAYASAHGSTRLIAEEIGRRLAARGMEVDVAEVSHVVAVDSYDAFVVGSAVHDRAWLPVASSFVRANVVVLSSRPLWLFSVSSVGDTSSFFPAPVAALMRRVQREPRPLAQFRALVEPRGHHSFAGAVERSHWNIAGHLFLMALGGRYADRRDHADIAAWADCIAAELGIPIPSA
jgi:menaquinone-dependent protoporphyrinogen oxidase